MAKRATQGASNKLPFAQEYCLFSPVGFKGNLSLLDFFPGDLSKLEEKEKHGKTTMASTQRGLRVVRAKSNCSFSRSSDWSPEELVLTLNDSPDSMAEGTISGGDFSRDTCGSVVAFRLWGRL